MFCLCFVCVSLVFFYVCQNPKILFSQNKILDFWWLLPDASAAQTKRMSDICETCGRHQFHIGCRFVPGLDFKLATAWHRGDGQLMFHICCKFHTHVLLYVSLMFQLYSIYVSFAFHICFVLCLTYVSYTFHICFVYVSHMCLLTPRHSLCLRHAPSTLYRNHPWSPFGSS